MASKSKKKQKRVAAEQHQRRVEQDRAAAERHRAGKPKSKRTIELYRTSEGPSQGKRLGAYAIDWALGGVVSGAPAVLMYSAVTRKTDMFSDLYVFEALGYPWFWGVLAGLLCVVLALAYYVYVPWKVWPGQTVGKRLLGLRVANARDCSVPSLGTLVLRQAVVGFLLESSGFVVGRYIMQMVTLVVRVDVASVWQLAGLVVTVVSFIMMMCSSKQLALHDRIAGTRVVEAPKAKKKDADA